MSETDNLKEVGRTSATQTIPECDCRFRNTCKVASTCCQSEILEDNSLCPELAMKELAKADTAKNFMWTNKVVEDVEALNLIMGDIWMAVQHGTANTHRIFPRYSLYAGSFHIVWPKPNWIDKSICVEISVVMEKDGNIVIYAYSVLPI